MSPVFPFAPTFLHPPRFGARAAVRLDLDAAPSPSYALDVRVFWDAI